NNPFFPEKIGNGKKSVNNDAPIINFEDSALEDVDCIAGEDQIITVSVEGDEGDYTYQWYSNTVNSNEGGTEIEGETGSSYSPPTNVHSRHTTM
ncbi:hypothetical protein, partial [Treponema sp. R6D11]